MLNLCVILDINSSNGFVYKLIDLCSISYLNDSLKEVWWKAYMQLLV
jgi:hypothetical protein